MGDKSPKSVNKQATQKKQAKQTAAQGKKDAAASNINPAPAQKK